MKVIGIDECSKFLSDLQVERESFNGQRRLLYQDQVKLDTVIAWNGTSDHDCDGSEVEIVYEAYKKPTKKQKQQAQGAKNAGVSLQIIKGRLVDLKENGDHTTLVLVTNGLRNNDDKIPFRSMNVHKGKCFAIGIDESLGMTADEAKLAAQAVANGGALPSSGQSSAMQNAQAINDATPDVIADGFDDLAEVEDKTDNTQSVDPDSADVHVDKRDQSIDEAHEEALRIEHPTGTMKIKSGKGTPITKETLNKLAKNIDELNVALDHKSLKKFIDEAVKKEVKRQLVEILMKAVNISDADTIAELAKLGGFKGIDEPEEEK